LGATVPKHAQLSAISNDFRLIANISGIDADIDKRKTEIGVISYNASGVRQKIGKPWSTKNVDYAANVYPPKVDTARAMYANSAPFVVNFNIPIFS